VLASVAAVALAIAGCGGDDRGKDVAATPTVPAPSTTVDVPEEVDLTAPGSQLGFGDTATVAHEAGDQGTVLELTVDSARQGSIEDLVGFELDDPYKRRGSYYYVRVTAKNAGEERLGDVPVPLWGISGEEKLLQAVSFTSSFKKCPTENLPRSFGPGDRFKTCLVFLSPNQGSLEGVSYRPTEEFEPIEWRGEVKPLPEPRKKGKRQRR